MARKRKAKLRCCSLQNCALLCFLGSILWALSSLHLFSPGFESHPHNHAHIRINHQGHLNAAGQVSDLKQLVVDVHRERTKAQESQQIQKFEGNNLPLVQQHTDGQHHLSRLQEQIVQHDLNHNPIENFQGPAEEHISVREKEKVPEERKGPPAAADRRPEVPRHPKHRGGTSNVAAQPGSGGGGLSPSSWGPAPGDGAAAAARHNPRALWALGDAAFEALYPALAAAVRAYRERHSSAHKSCIDRKGLGGYKVIVLDNHSGMGNQMLAHVSAFLIALLTDSVLVVKGNTYDYDVFENPGFDMRFQSWKQCHGALSGSRVTFDLTVQKDTKAAEKFLCTDFPNNMMASNGVYTFRGNVYVAPYFAYNRHTRDRVRELFTPGPSAPESARYTQMAAQRGAYQAWLLRGPYAAYNRSLAYDLEAPPELDIAAPLSRYVLRPHAEVFAQRARVLRERYGSANATHVVGVQMRTDGHDVFVKEDETWRRFARCGNLETFLKTSVDSNMKMKMMVATDTEGARANTQKIYNQFKSPESKSAVDFFFSSPRFLRSNTRAGKQEAVLDLLLLADADDLVITPRSTFGYWAAAWGGHRPLMIHHWITPGEAEKHRKQALGKGHQGRTFFMGIANNIKHHDMKYCVRRQSFEPVVHPLDQMEMSKLSCREEQLKMTDELMFHGRYW